MIEDTDPNSLSGMAPDGINWAAMQPPDEESIAWMNAPAGPIGFRPRPERENPKTGHPEFYDFADSLYDLHALKSAGYGNDGDPFANFTSIAHVTGRKRWEYPVERMLEKITRCVSLMAQERHDELAEEFKDIAGLAGCAEAMRREDTAALPDPGFETPERRGELCDCEVVGPHFPCDHEIDPHVAGEPPRNFLRVAEETCLHTWHVTGCPGDCYRRQKGVGLTD